MRVLAVFVSLAIAQNFQWEPVSTRTAPHDRFDHAMGHHEASGINVMFGGSYGLGDFGTFARYWTFDGAEWTPHDDPDGFVNFNRGGVVFAYHVTRDLLIGTGGVSCAVFDGFCDHNTDMITFDGASWRSSPTPFATHDYGIAYHSGTDRVIQFGGYATAGDLGGETSTFLGETWGLEADGSTWTLVTSTVTSSTSPSPRAKHSMVYDESRDEIVLFGGDDGALNGETFTFNGTEWARRNVLGPTPRSGHAMVYDPRYGIVILYGGLAATGPSAETWIWDGTSWSLGPSEGPGPRQDPAMVYDASAETIWLFGGGVDNFDVPGTTWQLVVGGVAVAVLEVESGASQIGEVDGVLPELLVVRALDSVGAPVVGTRIDWSSSDGTFVTSSTVTDLAGRARAQVRLGTRASNQTFRAASGTKTAIFEMVATPAPAAKLVVTAPSEAEIGQPIEAVLEARDRFENVATGYRGTVAFSSTDPLAETISPDPTFIDMNAGRLTVPRAIVFGTSGAQTVTVSDVNDGSITAPFDVAVREPNRPPAIVVEADRFEVHCTDRLEFTVAVEDPDRDRTQVVVGEQMPKGASFDDASSTFTWDPRCVDAGVHEFSFVASDGELQVEQTVRVVVVSSYYGCTATAPDGLVWWLLMVMAGAVVARLKARD